MNQKFTFDEAGIKAFNSYVYGLSTVDFQNCLTLLQVSFNSWLEHHFELGADQLVYLGALPPTFRQQCQSLIYLALSQQIEIALEESTTQQVFQEVLQGRADVAVGSDFGHDGLQVFPCGYCELAAVVPGQHLLADSEILDYAQLLPYEQIELNRDNGISAVFEQAARQAGVTRRISARVSSHETICNLVARGMGVAVVPMYLKPRHASPDIRFIALSGPWSGTPLCIAVRELGTLPPAARALLAHLGAAPWP